MEIDVTWIFQTAIMLVIALGEWGLKRSISGIDSKIDENKENINELEKDIGDFKLEVANNYVKKSDFNATTGQIMVKLDKIMDQITEIKVEQGGGRRNE